MINVIADFALHDNAPVAKIHGEPLLELPADLYIPLRRSRSSSTRSRARSTCCSI